MKFLQNLASKYVSAGSLVNISFNIFDNYLYFNYLHHQFRVEYHLCWILNTNKPNNALKNAHRFCIIWLLGRGSGRFWGKMISVLLFLDVWSRAVLPDTDGLLLHAVLFSDNTAERSTGAKWGTHRENHAPPVTATSCTIFMYVRLLLKVHILM